MTSEERREARYRRRKAKREAHKSPITFEEVFSVDNLWAAMRRCFRGVGWKASVQKVRVTQLTTLYVLYSKLHDGTYKSKPFFEFDIHERGKVRHIQATHISERIVQKCLCTALWQVMTPTLIRTNSASQKGRGVQYARKHFADAYRAHRDEYVLTFDVHSYFASIRHDEAKAIFARRLADERLVRLCCQFVDEFKGDVGVGLGSELSQVIAICYLNGIDHLGEQNGAYGRYMDDGYLFGQRETVRAFASAIKGRLAALGLSLNDKTQVNRAREGATFLKRVYRDGKVMMGGSCRRNSLRRVKKLRDVCDERREASYQTYRAIVMETNEPRARFAILNWE